MNKYNLFFASILSAGLVLSAVIVSFTMYSIKGFENTIVSTGSTKQQVTSDAVHWRLGISRIATNQTMKAGSL